MSLTLNRRTTLKILGAAIMAPCVNLRTEIDRERLLAAFCDDNDWQRYDFDRPFAIGSLTYATDARHMVRAELPARIEEGERRLPKGIEQVWSEWWQPQDFQPFHLPPVESLTLLPDQRWGGTCPVCDDRRISIGDRYPQSNDEAAELPEYDPDDNTIRDASCPLCRGRAYYGPCRVRLCGRLMDYSRVKPIAALPNVRVAATKHYHPESPLLFVADGFEGMAMGLIEDDRKY